MKHQGYFITFEGGEGCGKSTIIQEVKRNLEKQGVEVVVTREPGGVTVAEKIREVLVNEEMDGLTEAMLFASSRHEVIKQLILPALEEGKVVLCDRFIDSSLVYQGYVRKLGINQVFKINEPILQNCMPDLTLFLDLAPEVGLNRIATNNRETNKFDVEGMEFHQNVRQGYKVLSHHPSHQNRIKQINAENVVEKVVEDVLQEVHRVLQIS